MAFAIFLSTALLAQDSPHRVTDLGAARRASYVIVSAGDFAESCDVLLDHRAKQGHTVALVWIADIDRAVEEKDPPARLAAFLRRVHDRWGARFVLIVGDAAGKNGRALVPACTLESGYQSEKFASEKSLASDHPYSEPGLQVGRFPAATREELDVMIAKTIAYETSEVPGPWQRRVGFVTGQGRFGTVVDAIIEAQFSGLVARTLPAPYDVELAYAKPTSPYCPHPARFNENALRMINDGALFFVYVGHGRRTGCDELEWRRQSHPILDATHAGQLRAGSGRPVMVVLACSTGEFDSTAGDCLGETFLKARAGPVAFIGGSRVTQPYGNALLGKAFVEALLGDKPTLGEAVFEAKRRVIESDDSVFRTKADAVAAAVQGPAALEPMRSDVVRHYNLLGDPALVLRRPGNGVAMSVDGEVRPGRKIVVRGTCAVAQGRAIVSLDCPRDGFVKPPGKILASDPKIEEKFGARYRAANDKGLARAEVAVKQGAFEAELAVPEGTAPGRYVVRAFSWDARGSAMGALEVEIPE